MQNIIPIKWVPNKPDATIISVVNIDDNLETQSTFRWQLLDAIGALVDEGTVLCAGVEYLNWDGNRQFPYTFTADALGVTLL
jgi:hypothetical protein